MQPTLTRIYYNYIWIETYFELDIERKLNYIIDKDTLRTRYRAEIFIYC
jgi:hypothetical protein